MNQILPKIDKRNRVHYNPHMSVQEVIYFDMIMYRGYAEGLSKPKAFENAKESLRYFHEDSKVNVQKQMRLSALENEVVNSELSWVINDVQKKNNLTKYKFLKNYFKSKTLSGCMQNEEKDIIYQRVNYAYERTGGNGL